MSIISQRWSYLHKFPIDKIKIDQSFIRNCTSDLADATIVKMIIKMTHHLKLEVVAEGVEIREQLIFLQHNLCDQAQGYFFSMPLPPEELESYFYEIGQIVNREGISQNQYEQRKMEEALKKAQQELRITLRQQQGVIFKVVKENGKYIHTLCDGELLYQMGLTTEQVLGKELRDFLPLNQAEEKTKYFQRAWSGEEKVTYDGKMNGIDYIASLRPIRSGGQVAGVIGLCTDISEQKLAKEEWRVSESKYRFIAENVLDLILMLDIHGVVRYASPSHEKILGYPVKKFEGHRIAEWIHPDDLPAIRKLFITLLETKKLFQVEFRYKHANGGWVYVESRVTCICGKDGEIEQLVAVARNISEQKVKGESL